MRRVSPRRLGWWCVTLVVASLGCRHAPVAPGGSAQTLEDVARLRGLAWKTPPRVMTVQTLEPGADTASPAVRQLAWMLLAMGVVDETPQTRAHAQQVHGHYAPRDNTVQVMPAPALQRVALLHEGVHALQHQHFGVFSREPATPDAWLAWRALLEGDATLTSMDGVLEESGSWPLPHERVARDSLARLLVQNRAPADVLDTALTLDGVYAAAALRRVGGVALVNTALANPPVSTHQVLNPDAWVRGQAYGTVAAFPQAQLTAQGHRVEVDAPAGAFLAGWYLPLEVRELAMGVVADRMVVLSRDREEAALVWALVFDDDEDATRFVAGVHARAASPCLDLVRCDAGVPLWAEQDGRRAAVVRGLAPDLAEPLVTLALGLPVQAQPAAGLGNVAWVETPAREPYVDLIARARQMPARVSSGTLAVPSVGLRVAVDRAGWVSGEARADVVARFHHPSDGDITVKVVAAPEGAPLGAYANAALGRDLGAGRTWSDNTMRGVLKQDARGGVLVVQRGGFVVCVVAQGAAAGRALETARLERLVAPGGDET